MKNKFISSLLILVMIVCAMCTPVFAESFPEGKVNIREEGTPEATVKVSGPGGEETIVVPETGKDYYEYTFNFDQPITREYTVTQIPGSEPDIIYDDTVYIVRVASYYDDESGEPRTTVVVEKQGSTEKPDEICFKNAVMETMTVTRRITYTERTPDGREVAATKVQTVQLKRTVKKNNAGDYVDDDGNVLTPDQVKALYPWSIDDSVSTNDLSAVKSPDHPKKDTEGWVPNLATVGEWEIDLSDPKDEEIHVVYNPTKDYIVTSYEYKTITRKITYTEYTPDGKTVSVTVTQTVRLRRTRTDNLTTGKTTYSRWEIIDGDTGAIKSPKKSGWKADQDSVGEWIIDLDNPMDEEVIHVIYTPAKTPIDIIREIVKTSDATTIGVWVAVFVVAITMLIGALRKRRKRS